MKKEEIKLYMEQKAKYKQFHAISEFFKSIAHMNIEGYKCGEHLLQEVVQEITGINQNLNSWGVCFSEWIEWHFTKKDKDEN